MKAKNGNKKEVPGSKKESAKQDGIKQAIAKFCVEMETGFSAIGRAAKIYVETTARYGMEAEAQFKAAYPNVTDTTWDKLRRVGNGDLPPQSLLLTGMVFARVERMGPQERAKFFKDENGVEVYNPQLRKPEFVAYSKIGPRHEKVLYKEDGTMRTMEEQKAFVEDKPKAEPARPLPTYQIVNDTLVVNRRCTIGRKELTGILARMG